MVGRTRVEKGDFNSFGSRRGNHEIMMREPLPTCEFATNSHLERKVVTLLTIRPGKYPQCSMLHEQRWTDGCLAGSQYGTGSSRDWAAKGTYLLGVKAVIATSFERIHRSNLVGMGVLPLTFKEGESHESLGLDGTESFTIPVSNDVQPLQDLVVTATQSDGTNKEFTVSVRLDTPVEVEYYRNGGILHTVLRQLAATSESTS